MVTEKTVVLIVGGGWHTPDMYGKLVKALEAAGHEVHIPSHPSMEQIRPPTSGLVEDSKNLRAYTEKLADAGRRIVAVMHSYGGQVGTEALVGLGVDARAKSGKPGGVSDLVYVAAFALAEGGSMAGKVKEMGHEALMPVAFDFAEDMSVLCRDPKSQLVGSAAEGPEADEYLASLARWNGQCMYDTVSNTAWKEIPVTYVHTTQDMTVPLDYQRSMVSLLEDNDTKVMTYELETGHCPNLTATSDLVDVICNVIG